MIPPKAFFIQSTIIVAFLSHSNSLANLNAVSNTPFIDFEIVFAIVKNSVLAKALFISLAVSVPNVSNSNLETKVYAIPNAVFKPSLIAVPVAENKSLCIAPLIKVATLLAILFAFSCMLSQGMLSNAFASF